jgi:hypothetical protein
MSYGYMKTAVARIREDLAALVTHASQQDAAEEAAVGRRRGDEVPAELARREARLAKIEAAMRHVEAEATADADAARTRRFEADAERQRSGKKRQGKAPTEVDETPADKAQLSCTDPALHIMQTTNTGWDSGGNAHVSVDGASQIMVACDVTDATHDQQQAAPLGQAIRETLKQAAMAPRRNDAGERQAIPATLESGSDSDAAPQALEA